MNFRPNNSILALLALAAALSLCAVPAVADDNTARTSATKTIKVGDSFFSRTSISIRRNDSVRFKWDNTRKRHNVKVKTGPVKFKSKTRRGNYSYTKRFGTKGTYKLFCTLHPDSMKTTVKVR